MLCLDRKGTHLNIAKHEAEAEDEHDNVAFNRLVCQILEAVKS